MARLPYLNPEDVPAEYRALFLEQLSVPGRQAIHIMKILANAPALLPKFSAMGGALLAGQGLDPKLRELALEAVGIASGCEYEYVHHWNIALARAGVRASNWLISGTTRHRPCSTQASAPSFAMRWR